MRITVVIPALNEADRLASLLPVLAGETTAHDILVVDGGSTDGTMTVARQCGARVVSAPRGRGLQLRAGAQAAEGDVLWFLHADSRLVPGTLDAMARSLDEHPEAVGGNFRLVFDGNDGFSRWLDGFYAWLRRHDIYYGDSGIFARRTALLAIGGVPPLELMEDYVMVRRLQRQGPMLNITEPPLTTSSRRFRGRHPVAIVTGWLVIHLLFALGMSPARLARLYDSVRRRERTISREAAARR